MRVRKNTWKAAFSGCFFPQIVSNGQQPGFNGHFFFSTEHKSLFYMGGNWEEWSDKETGEVIKSFSLVTTDANPLMAKIHNDGERMPVIIPEDLQLDWLNNMLTKEDVLAMSVPYPEELMAAHTISKLITSRTEHTNVPEIQEKVDYPELATQQNLF